MIRHAATSNLSRRYLSRTSRTFRRSSAWVPKQKFDQMRDITNRLSMMERSFVTKDDFKEMRTQFKEELQELRTLFKEDSKELRMQFKEDFKELRTQMAAVKVDVGVLNSKELRMQFKEDFKELRTQIAAVKVDVGVLNRFLVIGLSILGTGLVGILGSGFVTWAISKHEVVDAGQQSTLEPGPETSSGRSTDMAKATSGTSQPDASSNTA